VKVSIYEIILTFFAMALVVLLPALVYRYGVKKAPLEEMAASKFSFVLAIVTLVIGFVLNKFVGLSVVVYADVLWVEIAYLILVKQDSIHITGKMVRDFITVKHVQDLLALSLGLFSLYTAFFGLFTDVVQRSVHLMLAIAILFLNYWCGEKAKKANKFERYTSIPFAILAIIVFGYTAFFYEDMAQNFGILTTWQYALGVIALLLMLEASRRTTGPVVPIVSLIFLAYALWGKYIPISGLSHRGYSFTRIISHLYVGTSGIFSTPLGACATILIMFMIFGSFLEETKGDTFFMDASFALTGRLVGGPAKAAVVSSCLMGMVSGSANANVATTGVFTIPLMKKSGYRAHVAGAVEAVASTGSQIMPPVMGTTAFIIAENLEIPYGSIVKAALVPALLYFVSVYMMVHLEACKFNLKVDNETELPNLKETCIKYGHSIIPLIVLIVQICQGRGASYTAMYAILLAVVVSWVRSYTRIGIRGCVRALIRASKSVITIAAVCGCAGIITGIVSLTGLGLKMSRLIVTLSHGNLLLALLITTVVLTILGMGLPTAPAYMLVATLVCPALTEMGVNQLAAHMFVFYGAIRAGITPPVCTVAYTAAGIADAKPMDVGLTGIRLGVVSILVPFFFVYQPALLGQGSAMEIAQAFVSGVIGCWGLSMGFEGFYRVKVNPVLRIVAIVGGILCIYPGTMTDVVGIAIVVAITAWQLVAGRSAKSATQPAM
jgi:TRAP transporter 4TM/12TM fusion protein